jgi:hypothetical protein
VFDRYAELTAANWYELTSDGGPFDAFSFDNLMNRGDATKRRYRKMQSLIHTHPDIPITIHPDDAAQAALLLERGRNGDISQDEVQHHMAPIIARAKAQVVPNIAVHIHNIVDHSLAPYSAELHDHTPEQWDRLNTDDEALYKHTGQAHYLRVEGGSYANRRAHLTVHNPHMLHDVLPHGQGDRDETLIHFGRDTYGFPSVR